VFDIGWSEMAVVLLVALIVIGPKDLPRVARTMGKWVAKGRSMAREFQSALEDMAREAELDKVKSEIEKAGRTDLGKTIENTIDPTGELGQAFDPTARSGPKPKADAGSKAKPEPAKTTDEPASPPASDAAPATAAAGDPAPAEPASSGSGTSSGPGNGQAADHGSEPRAGANGSGKKAPERETAPADPS
jgi:sec-independent protein translocase protein TatB